MFKKICCLLVVFLLTIFLSGCNCEHEWAEADCVNPKTCTKCNETEGDVLPHYWNAATCEKPETCSRCNLTKGEPLGHNWNAATCKNPETCSRCKDTRGTTLNHTWVAASCTKPKTCSVCQFTEGSALGHIEKEWEIVERDAVNATEVLKKYCSVCSEQLDRKESDMDSLHDGYYFLFTPNEFVSRFSDKLQSINNGDLFAVAGNSGDDFACLILSESTTEPIGAILFVGDGGSVKKSNKNKICLDGSLGMVYNDEYQAEVVIAMIQTCDPSLSFSDAKKIATNIASAGADVSKNGITYFLTFSSDSLILGFALDNS